MISIVSGLCMIMGLDVHPQLTRGNHGVAAAAQNNVQNDPNDNHSDIDDDDDDEVYVLDISDEE